MADKLYADIDEEGRLILPAQIIAEWGISKGDQIAVDYNGMDLSLKPPANILRRIYIEITNQCNLNCATCMRNVWDVAFGRMSLPTFEEIISGAEANRPKPEIFIGGYGEPLSHPDCLTMIRKAKSQGFRVLMITNGILLTEEVARELIVMGLDALWVSLDGASPECYADVRLGNALPTILENLRRLRSLQYQYYGIFPWGMLPRLGIAFVAMKRNIHDLPNLIRMGTRLGAVEYSVSNVLPHNQELSDESLYLRSLDYLNGPYANHWRPLVRFPKVDITGSTERVITELLGNGNRLELMGSELKMNGDRCPFVEKGSLSIRWDGKVSPCLPLMYTHTHFLDKRERTSKEYFTGDIHVDHIRAIWENPDYKALRQRLREFDFSPCTSCNSCELAAENVEDCYGNAHPTCGGCLWAQGFIRCP